MKRLFGTDGIRAVAGERPLDPVTVRRFGAALGQVLRGDAGSSARIVLGRDTRESGIWLRDAVADGLASCGVEAVDAGVITTPGLAHGIVRGGFRAGVMISASHNPFHDNGLKVFASDGLKLSDGLEREVEERILGSEMATPPAGTARLVSDPGLVREYVSFLEAVVTPRGRFSGQRVALDCANGSASAIAPEVFRHHGADVVCIGDRPDGRNINLDCGSLHLEALCRTTVEQRCDLGLAFDGDADRALAVDRRGRVLDGDHILYLAGRRLHRAGRLRGGAIVATVMSNLWLEKLLSAEGVTLHRAAVGDKYVLERMLQDDLVLGGEQSGHVIFREHASTGDGILTGLILLDTILAETRSLEQILDGVRPFPQVQLGVRVRERPDLRAHPAVGPTLLAIEQALADRGRVVLRYSGTEPVARVMVEGQDGEEVRRHAERLAQVIEEELGV